MNYLTNELGLTDNQKHISEVIAILHDIGRFEQFIKYRTYNDPRSVNHCLLGLEVMEKTKVLNDIEPKEKELIEKAIELHGEMELPASLDGECLLFCQLIRDADKIDIYYIVTSYYKQYEENPDDFKLELELPDKPEYSAELVEEILNGKRIDYHSLRSWNDMKLCQLSWVYDVNFAATLERIRERGFIEQICSYLPATVDIKKVRDKILGYIDAERKKEI